MQRPFYVISLIVCALFLFFGDRLPSAEDQTKGTLVYRSSPALFGAASVQSVAGDISLSFKRL